MKRFAIALVVIVGCADAAETFERHEKAAWAIEDEAVQIIDSVAAGGGPDDFKARLAEINERQAAEVKAARAARQGMKSRPTRDNEITTLEGLVSVMEGAAKIRAKTIEHANDFADASAPSDDIRMSDARSNVRFDAVDLMLKDQESRTELIKHKRQLSLLKGLYQD
jgi:hypothetical protein